MRPATFPERPGPADSAFSRALVCPLPSGGPRGARLLLLVVPIIAALPARAADEAQAVFARTAPSVVTVVARDEAGAVASQGSGVVVARERVATNCHVVRDAQTLVVQQENVERPAEWVQADRSRDLCLLAVAGLEAKPVPIRPLAGLKVGEPVHAVGNPLGFGLAVTSGLITHFAPVGGEQVILTSAPQSPGSSGGGLFDGEGRLVGISTSVLTAGQNLNIALPAEWIGELSQRGVAPAPTPTPPGPEPRWIVDAEALLGAGAWQRLEAHARAWAEAQPTAARARLELAVALQRQQRLPEAERALREALTLDDRLARAWSSLAEVLHRTGRRPEAEQALARAMEIEPGAALAYATKAEWLREDGKPEEARQLAERAVAMDPFIAHHWYVLGFVRHDLGQADAALQALRAALALNERDETLRSDLARLLAESGKSDEAQRALGPAAEGRGQADVWMAMGTTDFNRQRFATAEDAFRKATAADPENAEAWEKLGMTLARMLRDDEAAPALERALELDPDRVQARIERANLRARRGDLQAAIADARRATELAPTEPLAWRVLAVHSTAARNPRLAIEAYRRLGALGQANVEDYAQLGDLLGKLGDKTGAHAIFAKAEQLDPNNLSMLINQGGFYGRNGDGSKAEAYLDRALAIDPRHPSALSSKGYLLLLRGQPAEAAATLEKAVLLDPGQANAWINLGHAYLRKRDVGRAIPALEKAIALAPQALDAHLYLAQSYVLIKETGKAVHLAETMLTRQPDFPPALAILAFIHLAEGRVEAAGTSYGRLHSRDPQTARRLRAQALAGGLKGAAAWPE